MHYLFFFYDNCELRGRVWNCCFHISCYVKWFLLLKALLVGFLLLEAEYTLTDTLPFL